MLDVEVGELTGIIARALEPLPGEQRPGDHPELDERLKKE
jgi:hypothetical protein